MEAQALHEVAHARTDELPGALLEHPFGPQADVYKVRGKVFMLASVRQDDPIVTLKAAPADARILCEAYADITPGYHMNKRHWITVQSGGDVDAGLLRDLVTESYLLVVETLPRAQRPVNPETFGQWPGRAGPG